MKKLILAAVVTGTLAAPASAYDIGEAYRGAITLVSGGKKVIPSGPPAPVVLGRPADDPEEGPAAALRYEQATRGTPNPAGKSPYYGDRDARYPQAAPVPVAGLKNVVAMTPDLWTPDQLRADFKKNRSAEQKVILIFLKTEFCSQNAYRGCAVTTAAFEKRSTPLLRNVRIYGAWLEALNPERYKSDVALDWLDRVQRSYRFDQGPGANVLALFPASGRGTRTDAFELGLSQEEFEANGGRTPKLEKWLQSLLERAAQEEGR